MATANPLESMTLDQLKAESERVSGIFHQKQNDNADPRQVGLWRSRTNKVQEALNAKGKEEAEAKTNPETVNVRGRQAKRKGSMYCLCGCGAANNPGARFQVGHDARLKPKLKVAEQRFQRKAEGKAPTQKFVGGDIGLLDGLPAIVQDALADENQVYFKSCSVCGGPFLGNAEVGPACLKVG